MYAKTAHMEFSKELKYNAMVYKDVEMIELSIIDSSRPIQRLVLPSAKNTIVTQLGRTYLNKIKYTRHASSCG